MALYWDYEIEGELHDIEVDSFEKAEKYADEWWVEQQAHEDLRNNEIREIEVIYRSFVFDDTDKIYLTEVPRLLIYEHYHGDLKEHGTY